MLSKLFIGERMRVTGFRPSDADMLTRWDHDREFLRRDGQRCGTRCYGLLARGWHE